MKCKFCSSEMNEEVMNVFGKNGNLKSNWLICPSCSSIYDIEKGKYLEKYQESKGEVDVFKEFQKDFDLYLSTIGKNIHNYTEEDNKNYQKWVDCKKR